MRSVLFCAMLLGLTAERAAAQGQPVVIEDAPSVQIGGFAVGTANWDRLGPQGPTNSFSGDKIAVSLYEQAGSDAYFYGQLTTTLAPGVTSAVGIDIDHLFVIWTPHSLPSFSFEFGRLHFPGGVEADDEPLNFVPGKSFLFNYARPSSITGLIGRFTPVDNLQLVAAVADAWNAEQALNNGKTGIVRAEWIPVNGLTLGLTGSYGPQQDSTTSFQRTLATADITLDAGPFILEFEGDLGHQVNGTPTSDRWAGGELDLWLKLANHFGVSARYEDLDDTKGVVTGTPQVLSSFTVGPAFFVGTGQARMLANIERTTFHIPQMWVQLGIRANYSTVPFFPNSGGGLETRDTQGVIEVCFQF